MIGYEDAIQLIAPWLLEHGLRILGIIIAFFLLRPFGGIFIEKVIRRAVTSNHLLSKEAEKKRGDTLIRIFTTTFQVVTILILGLMIIAEFGVDTTPIIAGAGIIGIAVGFGGQYLIKDVISGLFIILENQYRVGDVVCAGDKCGLVEDITLRTTILRDLDGTVHHVPNGEISVASNLSKIYSRVNLNIGVSYSEDLEKVIKVVNKVGEDLARDRAWREFIKTPPKFLRVDDFADSAVVIKILGDTEPLKQWDVTGELRKRIKIAFDKNNIEIPFPQRVVYMKGN